MALPYQLRPPRNQAEEAELGAVLSHCFGFPRDVSDTWFDTAGRENLRVWAPFAPALAPRDVVGGLLCIPMGQFFGGRSVPTLGLAGVGVRLERRREGHAQRMVTAVLQEAHDRGFALSTLYASSIPLYRSVGYEQAGAAFHGTIDAKALAAAIPLGAGDGLSVRRLETGDYPACEQLYQAVARTSDGFLDRGPYVWQRTRREWMGEVPYLHGVVDASGALHGYVAYRQSRSGDELKLRVLDFVAVDAEATWRLWRVLSDQAMIVSSIIVPAAPWSAHKVILPNAALKLRHYENWMLRLVDVGRAFENRGYAASLEAELPFALTDPQLPHNDGHFVLRLAGGQAGWDRGGPGTIVTDVKALAAMYSGYVSVSMAEQLGWIEGPAWALQLLSALLASGGAPWMPDFF